MNFSNRRQKGMPADKCIARRHPFLFLFDNSILPRARIPDALWGILFSLRGDS